MSIRFVDNLEEQPKHGFFDLGTRIIFTQIKGIVKPTELINELTGEHVSFGVPVAA